MTALTATIAHLDWKHTPACEHPDHATHGGHAGPAWALIQAVCPHCGHAGTQYVCERGYRGTVWVHCPCGAPHGPRDEYWTVLRHVKARPQETT